MYRIDISETTRPGSYGVGRGLRGRVLAYYAFRFGAQQQLDDAVPAGLATPTVADTPNPRLTTSHNAHQVLEGLPASRHWESPAAGAEALESLAAVARFDIHIMLVPSRKKATVAAAFQPLEGGAGVAPDALAALRKKFRL